MDTLNSAAGITVFAPDNSAFAKIPPSTLKTVLADKPELTKILTYHVAGWPATRLTRHLIYVPIDSVLCSVCEEMKSAVESKPWFRQAHREYLDQVKVKKRILRGT